MAKKLQLSIAEPCHENWESMSPVEKARPDDPRLNDAVGQAVGRGKFCGSCQKQVVDFSNMSDRQIAEFFKKPILSLSKGGSICGRFMNDQLDRDIEIPRKRIPWLRYFFQILLPAFFISKASAQQKIGKVRPVNRDTSRIPIDHEIRTLGMVLPTNIIPVCKDTTDTQSVKGQVVNAAKKTDRVVVNGKVVNENGEAIPNVSVRIVSSGKIIAADGSGKFYFQTTKEQLIELELTSVGYQAERYIYPFTLNYSSEVDISIQMKSQAQDLPEVVCFVMGEIVTKQGLTSVVLKKDSIIMDEILDPVDVNKILVYPNPVTPGATINISFKKLEEGYYKIQLLSVSGQLVSQKEIWIDAEARVMNMEAPQVTTGTYFLVLVNKKTGKKFTEKIIIE